MSFYELSTGEKASGGEGANMEFFTTMPEGTIANAKIVKAELNEVREVGKVYQVEYELLDGEYRGQKVRQNIKCFDQDPHKADNAKEMLVRVMKLAEFSPGHSMAPSTDDLMGMLARVIQIKIGLWEIDEKSGNFVRGVYAKDEKEVVSGVFMPSKVKPKPIKTNTSADNAFGIDDDVPF